MSTPPDTACWQLLGLAPTPDEREVKRAYARLLKTTRPEDDALAFQQLRAAFEEAMWQADALRQQPPVASADAGERSERELAAEAMLRPHIEKLADLNEHGSSDETMAVLADLLDSFGLRDAATRDPVVWQLFEDGMLWVCCDIAANHDEFLRAAMQLFGWGEPGNWLGEKDPKTVEWLRLRLREADALEAVDRLLDAAEAGSEAAAVQELERLAEDDMLVNVDVRHLFEAELMVGMSALQPFPSTLAARALALFAWQRDHRHLYEYHPDAWQQFSRQAGVVASPGWLG